MKPTTLTLQHVTSTRIRRLNNARLAEELPRLANSAGRSAGAETRRRMATIERAAKIASLQKQDARKERVRVYSRALASLRPSGAKPAIVFRHFISDVGLQTAVAGFLNEGGHPKTLAFLSRDLALEPDRKSKEIAEQLGDSLTTEGLRHAIGCAREKGVAVTTTALVKLPRKMREALKSAVSTY